MFLELDISPNPTPYTLHPTPYTPHPAPYTLHPTPCTLHPTPYTLHPTPHPKPFTLHPTPHTLNPIPYTRNSQPLIPNPSHLVTLNPLHQAPGVRERGRYSQNLVDGRRPLPPHPRRAHQGPRAAIKPSFSIALILIPQVFGFRAAPVHIKDLGRVI